MSHRSRDGGSRRRARTLARLTGGLLILIDAVPGGAALAAPHPVLPHPPPSVATSTSIAVASASRPGSGAAPRARYSLLQMNLCLSGFAECFDDTRYPTVIGEAIDVIAARGPSVVTFNEACSGDIARMAQQTQYHVRFAPVLARGRRLRCVDPAGRGVFGNAVLTKAAIASSVDRAFAAQVGGEERRRWLCVETVRQVSVCTAHLSTRGADRTRTAHRSQCVEFAAVVAARDTRGPVIAAGDINQHHSCAPAGVWTLTDAQASQLPGKQHSYGSAREFARPQVQILPATYSDHDFMLTRTRLRPRAARPVQLHGLGGADCRMLSPVRSSGGEQPMEPRASLLTCEPRRPTEATATASRTPTAPRVLGTSAPHAQFHA